ncbi:MAG TPA: hypothetical protein VFE50_21740 [Cyclobacteriaceae bacterium]|nr:hypothetical protein [Cyclobacteriaceae bacterium]
MSCESDYTKAVKSELAKGVRADSLLFDIKFGTTREEFYGTCFDLNKRHIVTQGIGFSVQYMIKDSITGKKPVDIQMLFYPGFDTLDIVNAMNIEFRYPGWMPGERELQSDSLQSHVRAILTKWYGGNPFITARIHEQDIPVKVDGNRRILLFMEDEQRVLARISDLSHPEYMHKALSHKKDETVGEGK